MNISYCCSFTLETLNAETQAVFVFFFFLRYGNLRKCNVFYSVCWSNAELQVTGCTPPTHQRGNQLCFPHQCHQVPYYHLVSSETLPLGAFAFRFDDAFVLLSFAGFEHALNFGITVATLLRFWGMLTAEKSVSSLHCSLHLLNILAPWIICHIS